MSLVNIPDFIVADINVNETSAIKKIGLIIFGKVTSLVINTNQPKVICSFLNLFYKSTGKIKYENSFFTKNYGDNKKIFYPNLRFLRVARGVEFQFSKILDDYCLNELDFSSESLVVDCGANVGELFLSLINNKDVEVNYFAYEPDERSYLSLKKNISNNSNIYKIALSDKSQERSLFLDTEGGDSSLENFGSSEKIKVNSKRLDEYDYQDIYLLKIDAEGHELEVLRGSEKLLNKIKFISVDYGLEKGLEKRSTITEVTNFLFENNFILHKANVIRNTGLFINKVLK